MASVETIGSVIDKSPDEVDNSIKPVEVIPVGFTPSMVSALLLAKFNGPIFSAELPPEMVLIELPALVKVKVPAPFKASLLAVIAAVCVAAVLAVKLIVEFVAVKAAFTAIVPPKAVTGPAIVVAPPNVIFWVLVDFPKVKPLTVLAKLKLVIGKVNALAKLLLEGSMATLPEEFMAIPPAANAMLSAVIKTSLLELVIVPPCPMFILDGPEVRPLIIATAT